MTSPLFPTPEQKHAHAIRSVYAGAVNELRGDIDLSDAGRARRIADAHATARQRLNELRRGHRARLEAEQSKLRKRLYSGLRTGRLASGADVIASRDAQDRAERLENANEGAAALQRARANGDRSMAAAIGQYAELQSGNPLAKGWQEVLQQYVDSEPGGQELAQQLAAIEDVLTQRDLLGDDFAVSLPREARGGVQQHAESELTPEQAQHLAALSQYDWLNGRAAEVSPTS